MSVLVKGMKMPKGCYECPLTDGEYGDCKVGATGEYDPYRKGCPLEDLNVLCALADRACPFQGKEYAWCLTCPHISEEDRALVKKAIEPRTGEWEFDEDEGEYICSECKRLANVDNITGDWGCQGIAETAVRTCSITIRYMRGEEE